jgi:hypothetical protein
MNDAVATVVVSVEKAAYGALSLLLIRTQLFSEVNHEAMAEEVTMSTPTLL